MKSRTLTRITAMTLFAALAVPVRLAAQGQIKHFRHYKLVDTGTFGGPLSSINMATDINGRAANMRGVIVGFSATSVPKSPHSHPQICGGDDGFGSFVTHAFVWQNSTVADLGALPPGDTNCSNAYQVNANGEIAGFSENGEFDPQTGVNQSRAVHWQNGNIEELRSLGGNQSEALAINNRGQIVGFSLNTTADPFSLFDLILGSSTGTQSRAVLWDHGHTLDLGTLGGPDAGAFYINERGDIAGFSYTSPIPNATTGLPPIDPFLWEHGTMVDLGTLGGAFGGFTGQGGGLNNRGQVIGVSSLTAGACFMELGPNCDPFLWSRGKLIDLNTTTTGGNPLTADAINDAEEIVGSADFSIVGGSPFDAYIWRKGAATDLGSLNGDCFSRALAINSHGQVVGNSFSCDFNFDRAFLWERVSIVDLNSLIPPHSPLQLVAANDINDRAEIAGEGVPQGVDPNDVFTQGHAFLLIPVCEDGTEGCADAPLDPAIVVESRAVSGAAPKTMTPEEAATFKERIARMAGRNRSFGVWPRR